MVSPPKTIFLRILLFPLTRIILGIAFFIAVPTLVNDWVLKPVLGRIIPNDSAEQIIRWTISIFLLIFLYVFVFKIYERRIITELAIRYAWKENIIGFITGGLLVGCIILVFMVTGNIAFSIVNPLSVIFKPLILLVLLALLEEIIFRGIIYRITEQSLGTWLALIISAMLFGIGHITNSHADFLGILSVAVAGIFLGVLYTLKSRLWYPIAVHIGWNFFQYFFGLPISGKDDFVYFMDAHREGPAWYAGGDFGIENSILTVILILGFSIFLFYRARQQDRIIKPFWKR